MLIQCINTQTYPNFFIQYKLESYVEKRKVSQHQVPYHIGMFVDGSANGPPPHPNDISVSPDGNRLFERQRLSVDIPRSARLTTCREMVHHSTSCCNGAGVIKKYHRLDVSWKTKKDSFIVDKSGLSMSHIKKAAGCTIFIDSGRKVRPLLVFPDTEVNEKMVELLGQHQHQIPGRKVYAQRQVLKCIPVTLVTFSRDNRFSKFYIYDTDRKVYYENSFHNCIIM